jgi:hypothetical protein
MTRAEGRSACPSGPKVAAPSAGVVCHSPAFVPWRPEPARRAGFPAGLPFVWDATTLHNGTVFTLQTDIGEIDLVAEVAGPSDGGS